MWNTVASFTSDLNVSKKFANTKCVPDWYYDDSEWCVDIEYPFSRSLMNSCKLVPIIIKIDGNNDLLRLFSTEHTLNRFNESEYIMYVRDLEFEFVDVVDTIDDINVWLVRPMKSIDYNFC